jgi:hypothetical protein
MLATVIAFFLKRPALIGLAVLAVAFGVQHMMLGAARHDAQTAQDGWKTCRGSLAAQNAAVAAQSARSAAALAVAGKAVSAVTPRAQHYAAQGVKLGGAAPKGETQCAQIQDAIAQAKAAAR